MSCANCNKVFTCGCQKTFDDQGVAICKTCVSEWTNKRLNDKATNQKLPVKNLNLELAAQQIRDIRNS